MPSAPCDAAETALRTLLRERIRREGPIPVDEFMRTCLADPRHGYWHRSATIGTGGDFTTAPEISQVFGELIGLWCAVVWQAMGSPARLRLVELGPGRGTLMADALRSAKAVPGFLAALRVHLVEVSAPLRQLQQQTLAHSPNFAAWHESLGQVPEGPAIVIANEFLDALPIRQLVRRDGAWRERVVELDAHGGLRFALGSAAACPQDCGSPAPEEGAVLELRAGEAELLADLARRTAPLAALLIDYGPAEPAYGDTLQAVRRHAYVGPLADPGASDLTAHVQLARLAGKARAAGLAADGPITQAGFLGALGAAQRASRLMAANPAEAGAIEAGVQRLVSPTGMGQLFKVLSLRTPSLPPPPPFV